MVLLVSTIYLIIGVKIGQDAQKVENKGITIYTDSYVNEHLGDGASADWADSGKALLDAQGMSPLVSVRIHGKNSQDMVVANVFPALEESAHDEWEIPYNDWEEKGKDYYVDN